MIKLEISVILFLYLFSSVIIVLVLWIFNYRQKTADFRKDEDYIWRCAICAHTYIDSKDETISRCPLCGSLNKRRKAPEKRA